VRNSKVKNEERKKRMKIKERKKERKKDTVMLLLVNKSSLFGYKPY
jgi:hypothetical protein